MSCSHLETNSWKHLLTTCSCFISWSVIKRLKSSIYSLLGSQELTIDRLMGNNTEFQKKIILIVHVRCIRWGNCGMRFISVSLESCPPSYFFISLPFIVVCPTLEGSAGPTKKRCSATYFATIFKNLILLSPFFPPVFFHFSHQIFSFFPTSSFHFSHPILTFLLL